MQMDWKRLNETRAWSPISTGRGSRRQLTQQTNWVITVAGLWQLLEKLTNEALRNGLDCGLSTSGPNPAADVWGAYLYGEQLRSIFTTGQAERSPPPAGPAPVAVETPGTSASSADPVFPGTSCLCFSSSWRDAPSHTRCLFETRRSRILDISF